MRAQHHPSSLVKGRVAKLRHTAKFKQNKEKDGHAINAVVAMFRDASQFITVRGTNIGRLESGHLKYAASRDLHLDDLNTILKENPTEKDSCQGYDGSKTSLVY